MVPSRKLAPFRAGDPAPDPVSDDRATEFAGELARARAADDRRRRASHALRGREPLRACRESSVGRVQHAVSRRELPTWEMSVLAVEAGVSAGRPWNAVRDPGTRLW